MGYFELGIVLVGSVGAALLVGTSAALLRYRRTGAFPGQPEEASTEDTAAAVRGAKIRIVLGAALAAAGAAALAAALS